MLRLIENIAASFAGLSTAAHLIFLANLESRIQWRFTTRPATLNHLESLFVEAVGTYERTMP
ncbi:MAG TPA: hypothetical protein VFW07_28970 [Parafilimonas sp.]|nr:hypothetical protein [Parafilimonas sp.]